MSQGLNGKALLTESVKLTATVAEFAAINKSTGDVPAAGERCDGVVQTAGVADDVVPMVSLGTTTVVAGGVIANGAALEVETAGKFVTHSAGVKTAVARQAAAADGDELLVFLIPNA